MNFTMSTRIKSANKPDLPEGLGDYLEVFVQYADGREAVAPKRFPCVKPLEGPLGETITLIPSKDIAAKLATQSMLDQTVESIGHWPITKQADS